MLCMKRAPYPQFCSCRHYQVCFVLDAVLSRIANKAVVTQQHQTNGIFHKQVDAEVTVDVPRLSEPGPLQWSCQCLGDIALH